MITEMGRDLQNLDDDIILAKRIIKERICQDLDIIKYLHNEDLERAGADPENYLDVNILPYVRIPGTLDKVQNFICFSVDDMEDVRANELMKSQYIQFVIFCHGDDIDTRVPKREDGRRRRKRPQPLPEGESGVRRRGMAGTCPPAAPCRKEAGRAAELCRRIQDRQGGYLRPPPARQGALRNRRAAVPAAVTYRAA